MMKETGKYSDPIRIRAHHLLCMQGFQGYGYSRDFELYMVSLITYLSLNPSYNLQIIAGTDEICSHCPYKIKGSYERDCDSQNEIMKVDNLVIKKLDLNLKQFYTLEDATELVNSSLNPDDIWKYASNATGGISVFFSLYKQYDNVNFCFHFNWQN